MSPGFTTTQWTLVLAARDGSDTEARRALEALCNAYWYPLYAYLRGYGNSPDEARDLTQAFFAELLEKDSLQSIDRSKGKFRSFLLASLKNFLSHEYEKSQALKRGGGTTTVSMDAEEAETHFKIEPVDDLTPDQIFERRWGLTMMKRAMERLAAETASSSTSAHFEQMASYLTGAGTGTPYKEAAEQLGMSEGAFKTAVHRMRQRYGRLLREEIAETVADPAEVDDEVKHLLTVIRPWQADEPA